MLKVAFIGDSFSSYSQDGQEKNHWSYLLSQHFPQHQYINYSTGGRGFDHYRVAMLDAKMKDVDVVLTNETFNERNFSFITGSELFTLETEASSNYKTFVLRNMYWYSTHSDKLMYYGDETYKTPKSVEKVILETLRNTAASSRYYLYNTEWWNNVDTLYNFKHIVKLNLLRNPNHAIKNDVTDAYSRLLLAHGIDEARYETQQLQLYLDNDLIISINDDHWSPKANKWVFDNYILPKVVDILSE